MNNNTTIINGKGQILLFGLNHFIESVVKGDSCFICGANPDEKEFNNEHVIPNWLLKKHNLHDKNITLPNKTRLPYGKYKTPCCRDCNTQLGEQIEVPISNLLQNDYEGIKSQIEKDPQLIRLLFHWLGLIYLKTHLKDTQLDLNRDKRQDSGKIGDLHYWEDMHHIHCMSRAHYTNAQVDDDVYGSMFIFSAQTPMPYDVFDYMDNSTGKTIMLQSNDFCVMAALNDGNAGTSLMRENVNKINAPLHPLQIKEVFSHLAFISNSLKESPQFFSSLEKGLYSIGTVIPEKIHLDSFDEIKMYSDFVTPGDYLHFYVDGFFTGHPDEDEILDGVKKGQVGFLFDENGDFIRHNN